jgi:beta-lactam-binding protein with PASTA domain
VNGSQQSAARDVGEVVVAVRPGDRAAAPVAEALAQEVTSVAVGHGAKMVKVPALIGLPVRKVAEQAAVAGLNLQVEGRGLVRSQTPAAGAQVEAGSAVVVKCTR